MPPGANDVNTGRKTWVAIFCERASVSSGVYTPRALRWRPSCHRTYENACSTPCIELSFVPEAPLGWLPSSRALGRCSATGSLEKYALYRDRRKAKISISASQLLKITCVKTALCTSRAVVGLQRAPVIHMCKGRHLIVTLVQPCTYIRVAPLRSLLHYDLSPHLLKCICLSRRSNHRNHPHVLAKTSYHTCRTKRLSAFDTPFASIFGQRKMPCVQAACVFLPSQYGDRTCV